MVPNFQTFETIMINSAIDETKHTNHAWIRWFILHLGVFVVFVFCIFVLFFGGREERCKGFLGLIGGKCRKNEFLGGVFLLVNLGTLKDRLYV